MGEADEVGVMAVAMERTLPPFRRGVGAGIEGSLSNGFI
jgi:hypothetical protein